MYREHRISQQQGNEYLAIIIGGVGDSINGSAKFIYTWTALPGFDSKYFFWDGEAEEIAPMLDPAFSEFKPPGVALNFVHHDYQNIIQTLGQAQSRYRGIALIGHSYGGDTAMTVVRRSGIKLDLVVTLDAVSRRGYLQHLPFFRGASRKPANLYRWINVYVPFSTEKSNLVALVGGHWGHEPCADQNIRCGELVHSEADGMFKEMLHRVPAFLGPGEGPNDKLRTLMRPKYRDFRDGMPPRGGRVDKLCENRPASWAGSSVSV